jgi:ATP-dependent protease ClpP protease subunit
MAKDISQRRAALHDLHEYNIDCENREIYLHGYMGSEEGEPGVDYRMAVRFEKNLLFLSQNSKAPVVIHMHTIGGMWHDGMGMFDLIKATDCEITIIGYAEVSSMSSVIMQAAHRRLLMPHTRFMVHYGDMSIESNSVSVKSAVDENESLNRLMLEIYAERCSIGERFKDFSKNRIKKFLDTKMRQKQEWYMSAEEAVTCGFVDGIFKGRKQ